MAHTENWHDYFTYSDGSLLWKVRPSNRVRLGQKAGSKSNHGYILINFQGGSVRRPVYAHKIIWEMHNGPVPEGLVIDHKNRNRSDNRIENLRVITHIENTQSHNKNCVYFDKRRANKEKPWYGRVVVMGKESIKTFSSQEEALEWVNQVRLKATPVC
jgi:hypothetical protein